MAWRLQGLESTLNLLADSRGLGAVPDRLVRAGERLAALGHRLGRCRVEGTPGERLRTLVQRLHLAHPQRRLDQAAARLELLRQRLGHLAVRAAGEPRWPRLETARGRLAAVLDGRLGVLGHRLELLGARLGGNDPHGPLARGFVLVRDAAGRPITRAASAPNRAAVELQWEDGRRQATLED
jgi:exodeoxyribonuclease VII large subunit